MKENHTAMLNRRFRLAAAVAVFAASLAGNAFAASTDVGVTSNPQAGDILTDDRGMTLYRYTPDQLNTSTCYGGCAIAWPPALADSVPSVQDSRLAAGLGLAQRTDGTQQLTYNGMPLYLYVGDTKPGDITGQASDNVWFVVNP